MAILELDKVECQTGPKCQSTSSLPGNETLMLNMENGFTLLVEVAAVKETLPEDFWEPKQLVGHEVLIDGAKFRVTGVEAYAMMRSPTHPYRQSIGILTAPQSSVL